MLDVCSMCVDKNLKFVLTCVIVNARYSCTSTTHVIKYARIDAFCTLVWPQSSLWYE